MSGSPKNDDAARETRPPEGENNPSRQSDGLAPVLSYQNPTGRKAERRRTRTLSVRNGVLSVWGVVGFTALVFFATRDIRTLLFLAAGAVALLVIGISRWVADRNGGFLLGALLGTLTVMGTGALVFVVLCR